MPKSDADGNDLLDRAHDHQRKAAPRHEHTSHLAQRGELIGEELQAVLAEYEVEAGRAEGQALGVHAHRVDLQPEPARIGLQPVEHAG